MKTIHEHMKLTAPALLFIASLLLMSPAGQAKSRVPLARIGSSSSVKLEVASTSSEIERGLMFRTALSEDSGMVFLFHPPRAVNFWMYHTLIPLDMLFVRDGKIVKIFAHVPPCKSENPRDCPNYPSGPGITVSEVIEVNAGWAARHGVKAGDAVSFQLPE